MSAIPPLYRTRLAVMTVAIYSGQRFRGSPKRDSNPKLQKQTQRPNDYASHDKPHTRTLRRYQHKWRTDQHGYPDDVIPQPKRAFCFAHGTSLEPIVKEVENIYECSPTLNHLGHAGRASDGPIDANP